MNYAHYHPRRTHRKRFSALTLSSDTIQTLPEYSFPASSAWSTRQPSSATTEDPPSDRPPDYPDSAEEGDADTDESEANVLYVPQAHSSSLQASPKRARRLHSRKKAHSVSDPYLDSLLERSVHALEMSNALLQTSISTQSSLSTILDPENATERLLETHALRIKGNRSVHENWMDDLEEISEGVEGLFRDGEQAGNDENANAVSRSLPTSTMSDLSHRRRRSLDLRKAMYEAPQLQLSRLDRTDLIAPAPRAVTLYVASTTDPELITLPSTLGLRASASSHSSEGLSRRMSAASSQQDLRSSQSLPHLSGQASDHTTPAYNLLSTLAKRSGSATPPPLAMASPRGFSFRPRRGSNSTTSTERGSKFSRSPPTLRMPQSSPDGSSLSRRSRSVTPKPLTSPTIPRQMTPPIEELSASSSDSTSSSGHPTGYRTVQSLRKILDEQPSSLSLPNSASSKGKPKHLRAPSFFPRSPPPAPSSGTSTATASVSRLFTKSRHSSSTRPPSPPAHSSLKVRSVPPTPAPSPTALSLPEIFGNGVAKALGSTPSSGVSTPKRISFAELPESYAKSRPEGAPSKFSDKKARSKSRKSKGKRKGDRHQENESSDSGSWFSGWLLGGAATGMTVSKQEDRIARSWGNRPGFGTLDDWAV